MKITQGTVLWDQKTDSYVKSVPVDPLRPMTHRHHYAVRAEHGISVEMRFNLLVGVASYLTPQRVACPVIKKDNRPTPVVMGLTSEVEQALNDDRWNASLLEARLSMVSDR
jgi:hypothetical protein